MKKSKKVVSLILILTIALSVMATPAMAAGSESETVLGATDFTSRIMPAPFSWEGTLSVYRNLLAQAYFTVSCTGTVNVQNGDVLNAEAMIDPYHSVNMKTDTLDVRASISGKTVTIYVTGTIDFEWTEPSSGVTVKDRERINESWVIYPDELTD